MDRNLGREVSTDEPLGLPVLNGPTRKSRIVMSDQPAASANAREIEFWNSAATRQWHEEYSRIDEMFAGLTAHLLTCAAPQPGEYVLDIGCATGTTVLDLAARVGPDGHVTGADISRGSIMRGRERMVEAGVVNADLINDDVTVHEFSAQTFDLVFSRFGVMFFADPVASFKNIRRAMKPGGRFTGAAWRSPAENIWASAPARALGDLIPPPVPLGPEEPGQFSWADAARVERILREAGFSAIALSQHDPAIRLAGPGDIAGATNLTMNLGPVGRALRGENPPAPEAVRPLLEAYFATIDSPQGILLPGAIWIMQAVA